MAKARIELLPAPLPSKDWRGILRMAFVILFVTFGVLGVWASFARLDAAVVASGTISVESNRKTVQHLEGGIVAELMVRDGSVVREGEILLRLDPTRSEATDRTFRQQLAIWQALEARLLAQRDMHDTIQFPNEVTALRSESLVAVAINDNMRQFENRRDTLSRAIDVLERQMAQTRSEVAQASVDERTAGERAASIEVELPALRSLLRRGLVALPRVTQLERQLIEVTGARENAKLNVQKGEEKLSELTARIEQVRQEYRQEAANLLPDVRRNIGDVRQQLVMSTDALRRVDIRAPVSGTVQQLRVFTVGGVVRAGEPILDIVPQDDNLVIRARVVPYDRDRVRPDLPAEVRIPQFARYQLAPIMGSVRTLSRDSVPDEVTRQPYFAAEVVVEKSTIPQAIDGVLTAGMSVDVVIPTRGRSVLTYLLGPVFYSLSLSFRER